jgi:Ice-binding-like
MNARKNFLLSKSKKTLYLMTMALVATVALGLVLLSKSTAVSAQEDAQRSASKTATAGMLSLALNFGSASDYTVFADKGIAESDSRVGGKLGVGATDARAKEDLTKAFSVLENLPCAERNEEMRAGKFVSGVYCAKTGALKGQFVLDGAGNPNSIFVFRTEGKMSAGRDLNVQLTNGASAHNVFFVSGDTVDVEGVNLNGNVVARGSIKVSDDSTVGRAMSVAGKVDVKGATIEGATGVLQICKTAAALGVNGKGLEGANGPGRTGLDDRIFRFTVGGQTILVPVGSCSGPITVPAGPIVISELIDGLLIPTGTFSGRFRLVAVNTDPADALVDVNLAIRQVTVNIRPGTIQNQTVVEFINVFAVNAIIEICKFPAVDVAIGGTPLAPTVTPIPRSDTAAAQGDANIRDRDVLPGTPFEFMVDVLGNTVITVPVGGCSPAIQVNVPTFPAPVPAAAEVFVTEIGQWENDNILQFRCIYRLDGAPESLAASTFPASRFNSIDFNTGLEDDDGDGIADDIFANPCGGILGGDVLEGGVANQTTFNFWNRSEPGFVKVCKVAGFGIPIGTRFAFAVYGRESSNSPRVGTPGFPPTAPLPGNILPGVDTIRLLTVPAGPGPLGFCEFVRNTDATNLLLRAEYITGSQVLVQELGVAGDPRAIPVDPIPLNNQPFSIPAGSPGGVPCTTPTTPTNPCPQPQTTPPTGVRVGNIRLNAGASTFVSPSTINNVFILPGICTTAQGNATTNGFGSLTLNPNPSLGCRAAIFRARRTTVEVEFTDFLFRPVLLKVCKVAGPGGATGTVTFNFTVANPGGAFAPALTAVAPLTVPVGGCAFAQGPFTATATVPPVGTFAFGQVVTITEGSLAGVSVTSINCLAGTCSNIDLPNRRGDITLNATTVAGGVAVNEIVFTNSANPPAPGTPFDFDGDGKADFTVFRPEDGTWHLLRSAGGYTAARFGAGTDTLAAADYDGDRRYDIGVFRGGYWYILRSQDGFTGVQFGSPGDIPQAADFDGDGRADLGVFRPSNGAWYILGSKNGFMAQHFGASGDKPVAADFDGDKKADVAVFRGGYWYINRSRDGFIGIQFGIATDKPVAADYDGDGKTDIAVYRGGNWYILRSRDGFIGIGFGIESDIPVPADYNGDGKTDIAVFRDGTWHVLDSGTVQIPYRAIQFGSASDMPVPYR